MKNIVEKTKERAQEKEGTIDAMLQLCHSATVCR